MGRRPEAVSRDLAIEMAEKDGITLDDAPRHLSREKRSVWINAYGTSVSFYPSPKWSQLCRFDIANRAAREIGSRKLSGRPRYLPDPKNGLVLLGQVVELHYVTPCGRIARLPFNDRPDLLWSTHCRFDSAKGSLFIFPKRRVPPPGPKCPANIRLAMKIFEEWNDCRVKPQGCTPMSYDRSMMRPADPLIGILYQSDKFTPGKKTHYIHADSKDVFLLQSAPGNTECYFIGGGKLKIGRAGLEN